MTNRYSPVPELNLLAEFEAGADDLYAAGFSLGEFGRDNGFLKNPELEARLILFAEANASGSLYALWRVDDRTDLATLPVAILGDAWLERHFGPAPANDPGAIVEAARAELGERFGAWLAPRIGRA
ncbi:hypothetical protein ACH4S9_40640 [Streptomyces sp. NPDC021225]|uniref:hypothetical protein n=1 Tax=Streptomyces sp. NPDC021225 TaxID=3365121 RepID=UPI003793E509